MILVAVASRHPDELNADFLRLYHVSDWRALPPSVAASLCAAMIRQPESWTHRVLNPDWRWNDPARYALALIADYTALLTWFQTKDGQKNRNRPKPFPRPGSQGWRVAGQGSMGKSELHAVTMDELDAILALPRGHAD